MNKNKKILLVFAASALVAGVAVSVSPTVANTLKGTVAEARHVGNHYNAVSATKTTAGVREYWVCCDCHEIFLEEGTGNTWTDKGYATSEVVAEVNANPSDPRYLPTHNTSFTAGYATDVIYGDGENTKILGSTGMNHAKITAETTNALMADGVKYVSFAVEFEPGEVDSTKYQSVVRATSDAGYRTDTTGRNEFTYELVEDLEINVWIQLGAYGSKTKELTIKDYTEWKDSLELDFYTGKAFSNVNGGAINCNLVRKEIQVDGTWQVNVAPAWLAKAAEDGNTYFQFDAELQDNKTVALQRDNGQYFTTEAGLVKVGFPLSGTAVFRGKKASNTSYQDNASGSNPGTTTGSKFTMKNLQIGGNEARQNYSRAVLNSLLKINNAWDYIKHNGFADNDFNFDNTTLNLSSNNSFYFTPDFLEELTYANYTNFNLNVALGQVDGQDAPTTIYMSNGSYTMTTSLSTATLSVDPTRINKSSNLVFSSRTKTAGVSATWTISDLTYSACELAERHFNNDAKGMNALWSIRASQLKNVPGYAYYGATGNGTGQVGALVYSNGADITVTNGETTQSHKAVFFGNDLHVAGYTTPAEGDVVTFKAGTYQDPTNQWGVSRTLTIGADVSYRYVGGEFVEVK